MRSQKKTNKAPRPFKNNKSGGKWSGGRNQDAYLPPPKAIFTEPKKKPAAEQLPPSHDNATQG